MKDSKWFSLYENDILRNGGYKTYYLKKIKYRQKFIKKIEQYSKSEKVLESGCGTGVLSINLALKGYESFAVDYDNNMLKLVEKIAVNIGGKSNVPILIKKDIFELDKYFKSDEFDVIYSIGVYEHYKDNDIKRLLKSQLKISKYVFVGIPTKYFNENEKLYGNERFLSVKYWRNLLISEKCKIVEEFSCYNDSFLNRLIRYKKWFKPAPIYVFVIKKL